ncbi:MAG TPA: hypothetical protein VHH36_05550 [Candidatus Thermoplasmatota archaeon]|nr:hypothetical protein [Candidatus Thermoplasmatota archaeon]
MRPLVLLLVLVLMAGAAYAQNDSASTNGTTNATANATMQEGNATGDGDAQAPAGPQTVRFVLIGHESPTQWEVEGMAGRNPMLTVPAGAEIVFTVRQAPGETTPHNLQVGSGPVSKESVTNPGDEFEYAYKAPESGTFRYVCQIHGSAMAGTIRVQSASEPQPGGDAEETINGETVSLKQIAADAACDREIPAIVTRQVVGGPTVADYAAGCVQTTGDEKPAAHPADLVLPLTWGAIALGVVGLVWVHKSYKP